MTGVCPQHDVLFDQLTPREHLRFFGRIRGIPKDRLELEVERTLKDIDLSNKGDTRAAKLSGGQKRKLSIGIALIGDPKIIFLDEPTAGVDPYSRRHLWNLLQQRKAGKVPLCASINGINGRIDGMSIKGDPADDALHGRSRFAV
jgi:ATP-binding cassette, subfamily A (ABC1), member 5